MQRECDRHYQGAQPHTRLHKASPGLHRALQGFRYLRLPWASQFAAQFSAEFCVPSFTFSPTPTINILQIPSKNTLACTNSDLSSHPRYGAAWTAIYLHSRNILLSPFSTLGIDRPSTGYHATTLAACASGCVARHVVVQGLRRASGPSGTG